MIAHPLSGFGREDVDDSGDFSVANIVDADGGYAGDYPAYHEASGDFGTLGQPGLSTEDMGFGRRGPTSFKRKITKPLARVTQPVVRAAPIVSAPAVARPLTTKPKGLLARRYARGKKLAAPGSRSGLARKGRRKMTIPQPRPASVVVPRPVAPQVAVPVVAASLATIPQLRPASVTVPEVTRGQVISAPAAQREQVVSTGGQISQQKIEAAGARAQVQAQARRRRGIRISQEHAHPMARFSRTMGEENEMGFLKNLWSDAKTKAEEELRKARAKLEADLKMRAGQAISNVSSQILQKPEVQAVVAERAQQGIVQSVAQKLLDPEVQKKAAIASVGTLAVVGALAYFALKKK